MVPADDELRPVPDVRRALLAAQRAGTLEGSPLPDFAFDELEATIDGAAVNQDPPPQGAEHIGMPSIVGYRFLREISHGGQATVFKAVQESTGRNVAVKVIPGGPYLNSKNRARFEREVKALAAVDHPNVVGVLDSGRTSDGSFFLTMDYVEGRCLDTRAAEGPARDDFDPRPTLILFGKIVRAVHEVHRSGVIHRDLKPSNVLIDARGEPHVLDFGLVRLLQEADDVRTYTLTGQIIGSLPWASPEQAAGGSARLDVRSDIYSLGVMLYQALTGSFPYAVNGSVSAILENIQTATPTAPSRLIRRWCGIDARMADAVLFKAMAKSPHDRYESSAELASDLDSLLAHQPTVAKPRRGLGVRGKRLCTAAALVLVLAGAATYVWPVRADPPVTVFRLPRYTNSIGMKLVRIPPGQFIMGSGFQEEDRSKDEARHAARVDKAFWLGITPVTRGQYNAVMGNRGGGDANLPVVDVSWSEATEFCRLLSEREHRVYRLPTETEREYACRAGSVGPISGTGNLDSMGWYAGNSRGTIHPVAQLSPNCWGLYDMHGGVNEWCSDVYDRGGARDAEIYNHDMPTEWVSRSIRGGSFTQPFAACRAAARSQFRPQQHRENLGFRVALDP